MALADVKAVITNALADMQAPLKHVVGAMADMEQLRAQCQASSTSSQVTPFTKSSKRDMPRILGSQTDHVGPLQQYIDAWRRAERDDEGPAINELSCSCNGCKLSPIMARM